VTNEKRYCVIVGKPNIALRRLAQVLQQRFEVITAESHDGAVLATTVFQPTLAVIPQDAGGGSGELARRMAAAWPGIAIVHFTDGDPDEMVDGKRREPTPNAASRAARRAIAADPAAIDGGNGRDHQPHDDGEHPGRVTPRERQVLTLLERGLSMKETARLLAIAPRTVAFHKYHAMACNGLHNNAELRNFAVREGILTLRAPDESDSKKTDAIEPQRHD